MTTCSFSQGYTDFDGSSASADCRSDATWLVWFPPTGEQYESEHGTVVPLCGDHLLTAEVESPDAERVQISTLPMMCQSCGDPVWASHAQDHAVITADECEFCHGLAEIRAAQGIDVPTATEHARCSCPEEAAMLAAFASSDEA